MKALVLNAIGRGFDFEDVDIAAPIGREVLIEVRASGLCHSSQMRAGRVVINGMTDDPQAPWGGFKYSGVGREYGRYGIDAFLETRAILES